MTMKPDRQRDRQTDQFLWWYWNVVVQGWTWQLWPADV